MTFPLRLLFPQNYHRFHVQEQCLHHMLQTVQKPTKSWKGPRFNNKPSDQIRWLPITSIDAPRIHPLLTQLPPRRSALLHPPDLHSIVTNLVSAEAKVCQGFVDAQGIGQGLEEMESKASIRWLMNDSSQNSKSQTSSNFWCLDISQVTWTNILFARKLPAHWS